MSDIMALYSEGASSLCVNGSVDMLGRRTSLAGIVYQGYDPFEDAPQKGEFDWGGFARNLAIGLGVAIACVGLALIPGIGPIVTGALIGAAIGTFCQTVYKANEEWQSGNVRSTIETVRDVVISAAAGGFTGACVVAFPVTVLFSGEIYAGVSLTGRAAWALGDSSMNNEKKMAYIFDTKQMAVDFSIGALIGIIVPGAVARKLVRDAERNMLKNTCESGTETDLFLPDEFYNKNLPNQVAPGTKYLPKYDELGNVKQIKMYDDYGREIGWVDYTNHGYGDINSPHYHTTPHWHEKIYNAQYPDGIKINHRTDVNTPLGDQL